MSTSRDEFEHISEFLRSRPGCNHQVVEEVVQGTFSRLIDADQLELIRDPEHHLFTLACQAVRTQQERLSQSNDTSTAAEIWEGQSAISTSEIETGMDRGRLLSAMEALPESLQMALILSTLGMTHSQIASSLGLSVDETLAKLVQARVQLMLVTKKVDV